MFKQEKFLALRHQAEMKLANLVPPKDAVERDLQTWLTKECANEVIHELQVRQIELELQNEELRQTQILLEESRDRYFDLYEFAPIGYFMLTTEGVIVSCNLAGAELVCVPERAKLLNRRFANFVAAEDLERWNFYFIRAKQNTQKDTQTIKLKLYRTDGSILKVQLDTRFDTQNLIRITVINLTEQ